MIEEWKDIVGYEGLYKVSNIGRVYGVKRKHILKHNSNHGYFLVCLCKCGAEKYFRIHRLVAEAFIPNPDKLPYVNHKDENKQNNAVDNLEWCTAQYNTEYSQAKPIMCIATGVKYKSVREASRQTGIAIQSLINACQAGMRAGGYTWKYLGGDI